MADSVTLRDVAQYAGVSIGTASQALNNRPGVSAETRARVLDAARALGYSFKEDGEFLESCPLKIIGLVTKHDLGFPIEVNAFYSHIQVGVESECRRRQIGLMYASIEVDPSNHPVIWPTVISEQQIDGLILAGTFIEEFPEEFSRRINVPVVLVDSYAPHLPFDSVLIDNMPGAMSAVEYLVQQGHQQIGLIGWHEKSPPSIQERKLGYCRVLAEHGLDVHIQPSGLRREESPDALQRLLENHPGVTAVFCCNDLSALGVLVAAREMGLVVPRDLSVMGFDNIDTSSDVTPALTTVHVHKSWLGTLSAQLLIMRAMMPAMPRVTLTVSTQLVIRDSVCPPTR